MPFIKLEDACNLRFTDDRTVVDSPVHYMAWQAERLQERGVARPAKSPFMLAARVNHGRWIVDCQCGAGILTHPEWRIACCAGCGAVHTKVSFPPFAEELARLLLARPRRENQNWSPAESLEDIAKENAAYGLAEEGAE